MTILYKSINASTCDFMQPWLLLKTGHQTHTQKKISNASGELYWVRLLLQNQGSNEAIHGTENLVNVAQ